MCCKYCSVLQCIAVYRSVLSLAFEVVASGVSQCVAVYCSVLMCVDVCCSVFSVLQCVF